MLQPSQLIWTDRKQNFCFVEIIRKQAQISVAVRAEQTKPHLVKVKTSDQKAEKRTEKDVAIF